MKILELIESLKDCFERNGDVNVEVCKYTDEHTSYYWTSCAFEKDGKFIIGYNVASLRKRED